MILLENNAAKPEAISPFEIHQRWPVGHSILSWTASIKRFPIFLPPGKFTFLLTQ